MKINNEVNDGFYNFLLIFNSTLNIIKTLNVYKIFVDIFTCIKYYSNSLCIYLYEV